MYCAIIGDIIRSRNINDRKVVQMELFKILERVNEKYAEHIEAKFLITIGDEFQGLLNTPEKLLEIVDFIQMRFYPEKLRFGIGFGEITTHINNAMAIGADGPAYYIARKAIEKVKMNEKGKERPEKNILIYNADNNHVEEYDLINSTLSLCSLIENRWSEKQREVIAKLMELDFSQTELANDMGIAQSSIHRRIDASGYYSYIEARKSLKNYIMKIWEDKSE